MPSFLRALASSLASACLLALALPSTGQGQSIVQGELQGRITSLSGAPIPEAEVGATNERTGLTRYGTTGRDGTYQITGLDPGDFTLRLEALGFRPRVWSSVTIRPGRSLDFDASLEPSAPPVESADVQTYAEGAAIRRTEDGQRWFSRRELTANPDLFPGLAQVSELSSGWDAHGGAQGLPGSLSRIYVDGVPFTAADHPYRPSDPLSLVGLPRIGLGGVTLLESATDVEWTGSPGGYMAVSTPPAATSTGGSLSVQGSYQNLWASEFFDGIPPDGTSFWVDGSADLALGGGSSRLFVAGEAISTKTPRWLGLDESLRSALVSETGGTEGGRDFRNWENEVTAYSGLGRMDWSLDSGGAVMARLNLARTEESASRYFGAPVDYGHASPHVATDLSSLLSVSAPLNDRFALEVRWGFERSERAYGEEAEADLGSIAPPTRVIQRRTLLGAAPGSDGRVLRTAFLGGPVLHADLGPHRFKGGVDVSIPSYGYTFRPPVDGFLFSDEVGLQDRRGFYTGIDGGGASTTFTIPRIAGFFQYRWTPATELTVTSGLRWDHEFLPGDQISFNESWWDLTGLSNVNVPGSAGSWGGRLGVAWDVEGAGSTRIHGAVGAHSGRIDPSRFHEAILMDGFVGVRRAMGFLGSWPEAPDESVMGEPVPTLALVDPNIRAPVTTRASLSLSRRLRPGAVLRFSGTYRRTERLPRRTDLNRVLLPVAQSNLDRPIYGDLVRIGSVVQAVPGSNRRVGGFGTVWGLNSDGWSEYTAASLGLDYSWGALDGYAEYTLSRTEDNWAGAAMGLPDARLAPGLFPGRSGAGPGPAAGAVWEEGTSDFDLPHRFVAGFDLALGESGTVGVTYRLQSGYPFTPSYPAGTDVNADGSGLNDPAFVPDVPAIRQLAQDWECLDEWIDQIVERNACRAPTEHTFDFRLHFTLAEWSGGEFQVLLEGFNLLDARTGPRDEALLLVDPESAITGQGTGTVNIPTVVNPEFGEPIYPTGSGLRGRIGFRLGAP